MAPAGPGLRRAAPARSAGPCWADSTPARRTSAAATAGWWAILQRSITLPRGLDAEHRTLAGVFDHFVFRQYVEKPIGTLSNIPDAFPELCQQRFAPHLLAAI